MLIKGWLAESTLWLAESTLWLAESTLWLAENTLWLASKKGRGMTSSAVAIFFVEEGLRLGWASRGAAWSGAWVVGVYNIWDIVAGGVSWKRAEYVLHHLIAAVGCGMIIQSLRTGDRKAYEKLRPLVYWMGIAEVTTIFNGLRVAVGGTITKSMFAISFLTLRPIASYGAIRVLVKKWAERSQGENAILVPLIGCFVSLNTLWSYKILLEINRFKKKNR